MADTSFDAEVAAALAAFAKTQANIPDSGTASVTVLADGNAPVYDSTVHYG